LNIISYFWPVLISRRIYLKNKSPSFFIIFHHFSVDVPRTPGAMEQPFFSESGSGAADLPSCTVGRATLQSRLCSVLCCAVVHPSGLSPHWCTTWCISVCLF
jgi:hypothetical protein